MFVSKKHRTNLAGSKISCGCSLLGWSLPADSAHAHFVVDDPILGQAAAQPGARFLTTRWSLVLAAGDTTAPAAADALETLCQAYWMPLYLFVRRQGYEPADAEDLMQAFFERVLEKNYLAQVRREKGRFRSFLMASLRHFLADERDRSAAAKRGGSGRHLSLDVAVAEATYARLAVDQETPEKIYERQWAMAVLERAQGRLRAECLAAGKGELYRQLGETDGAVPRESYADIGARFGMTENAVKLAAFRLRRRLRIAVFRSPVLLSTRWTPALRQN